MLLLLINLLEIALVLGVWLVAWTNRPPFIAFTDGFSTVLLGGTLGPTGREQLVQTIGYACGVVLLLVALVVATAMISMKFRERTKDEQSNAETRERDQLRLT